MSKKPDPSRRQRARALFITQAGRPTRLSWWLGGIVLGYFALFGLILPYVLRGVLEKQLSAALNTRVSVASLSCNPLTLTVTARGIVIPYPEGKAPEDSGPFLTLDELRITPSFVSYLRLAPGIKSLHLTRPVVDVTLLSNGGLSPQLFFPEQQEEGEKKAGDGQKAVFPFLIYGLELTDGKLIFRDAIRETTSTISDINLNVPFASTLKADRGIAVTPGLNATLNGRPLVFTGKALPFAEPLRTEFTLLSGELELEPFRAYLAPYTPLRLESGAVHAELVLSMERAPETPMRIALSGKFGLDKLDLAAPDGARALALEKGRLEVESALFGPLHLIVKECSLEKPYLAVRRKADGALDWQGFITLPTEKAPPRRAAPESIPSANATAQHTANATVQRAVNATAQHSANATAPAAPARGAENGDAARIVAHSVRLSDGVVVWRDDTVPGGFSHTLDNIQITLSDLDTRDAGFVRFDLALGAEKQNGTIALAGQAVLAPPAVNATLKAGGIPLRLAAPYVAQALPLVLEGGTLESDAVLTLAQVRDGGLRAALAKGEVAVADLALSQTSGGGTSGTPLLKVARISVGETTADTAARAVTLGKIDISKAAVSLIRQSNGEMLLPVPPGGGGDGGGGAPWRADLGTLRLTNSSLTLQDRELKPPAELALSDVACEVKGFSTEAGKPFSADLSFKPGRGGSLSAKAEGTLTPLSLRWQTQCAKVDLRALGPYLGEFSTLTLAGASLSGKVDGAVAVPRPGAAPDIKARGSLSLDNVTLNDGKSEFASLDRFSLQSLNYASAPRSNGVLSVERVSVERPRLTLAMQQNGTLSLARIFPARRGESAPAKAASGKAPPASSGSAAPTVVGGLEKAGVGTLSIADGRFTFRDLRFPRPTVVSLSDIALNVKNLRSEAAARSDFTLAAKVNGAPLNAKGDVNPLIQPPVLDSRLSLKGFNLPSVSPYAEKFIDHAITKGQLSLDTSIQLADKQVNAQNRLLFTQLSLGDKLNRPGAANLPVKAAISLLSDMNGDVNLSIPVSGSMDDPQFRAGALVGKVFANIMLKTVTSPFSLLTGVVGGTINLLSGGGGPDQDAVSFRPGSDRLDEQEKNTLASLAAALKRRPGLRLTLIGHADGSERAAVVDAMVRRRMREEKYSALPRAERAKTTAEEQRVSRQEDAEEYARLLEKVYLDMAFVRMAGPEARNQPPQEMLRRIHEHIKVSDGDLKELAEARAKAVQSALLAVDPSLAKQISLGTPVVTLDGKPGDKPTTQVKLQMR